MTIDCGAREWTGDRAPEQPSNDTGHVPRSGEGPPICQDILPGSGAKISNKVVTVLVEQKYSFIEGNETFFQLNKDNFNVFNRLQVSDLVPVKGLVWGQSGWSSRARRGHGQDGSETPDSSHEMQ